MHRRDVLLQLPALGLLAVVPKFAAASWERAPFTWVTDQPLAAPAVTCIVRIPANALLSPSWHLGLRVRSIRAVLGGSNAVLLMESLRDLRAAVHLVHREGELELIGATLPAQSA